MNTTMDIRSFFQRKKLSCIFVDVGVDGGLIVSTKREREENEDRTEMEQEQQLLTSIPRCDPSLWPGDDAELLAASQSVEDSLKSQHSLSASQPLKQQLTSRGASSSQTSGTQENSAPLSEEFETTVQSHQNKATVQPKHRESTEAAVRSKKLDTIGLTESSASQGHDHITQLPLSHSPVELEGWVRLWENPNGIPSADISWLKEDTERGLFTPFQTYKDVTYHSVKSRFEFKILLLTYKVLNNQAPSYLNDLVVPYHPIRALRSRSAGLLVVPRVFKSRMGGRAFSFQAPLLWNQLPVWIRETDTISTFKIRLKTFLFAKAYS
ncbi:uncharacterized protein LOC134624237 [Pelmatolapia mariae]|uniref:uncharacterized protein LOC134624237 n=1 Tax=Pelmatolapia mariae TaxID=158779 RepID=UPI003211D59C